MAVEKFSFEALPEDKVNDKISRWMSVGQHMSVAKYVIKRGGVAPLHQHPNEQVTMMLQGRFRYSIDGKEIVLGPGEVVFIPPNAVHGVEALEDAIAIDFSSPPRLDMQSGTDPVKKLATKS